MYTIKAKLPMEEWLKEHQDRTWLDYFASLFGWRKSFTCKHIITPLLSYRVNGIEAVNLIAVCKIPMQGIMFVQYFKFDHRNSVMTELDYTRARHYVVTQFKTNRGFEKLNKELDK